VSSALTVAWPPSRPAPQEAPRGARQGALKTQLEWFQDLARDAWQRGQSAMSAGRLPDALRWLERANRIAPEDAGIALALAGIRIRAGQHEAAQSVLLALADRHDMRELWFGLASVRRSIGAAAPAAAALGRALSRHALPDQPHLLAMADGIAADAGLPGWCGMREDGRLVVRLSGGGRARITVDGQPRALERRRVAPGARRVDIRLGERDLLGSPIAVADIRRVEGIVWARDGGLEGWAWLPAAPDTDPLLSVRAAGSPRGLAVIADDRDMVAATPLARPRRFRVPAEQLRGMDGPVSVTTPDGRALLGSPLDPAAERQAAAVVARAVARRFPAVAGDATVEETALAAIPAEIRGPPAAARPRPNRAVAVVVPVHGNAKLVHDCLHALAATIPPGTAVIVVDDASPGPEIAALLALFRVRPRWRVLHHAVNRGFPAAANTGLRAAAALPGQHDVILLNSDTLTPPGWVEALRQAVHAAGDIGTATPLSNDATIVSYPDPAGGPALPIPLRRLSALAAAANRGVAVEIPTAVGFCMYVRSECLRQTGLFREDVFAQGYGEENDFCIRARHLGWRHVAVPSLLVAHLGGQSFGTARAQLTQRNLAVLERLHPGYHALIASFQAADPLAEPRRRLDALRWRAGRMRGGAVVLVTHDSGGGVERVVRERAAALRAAGRRPILLRAVMARDGRREYLPGLCRVDDDGGGFPNLRYRVPQELRELARLLRGDRVQHVELHHLLGHDHAVLRLARLLDVPVETHLHDYALFCPRISLVGRDGRYCGEPGELAVCEACVRDLGRNTAEDIPVATLRARSLADLAASRRVVVPSADAAARLCRHFPATSPVVEPLEDDGDLPPDRPPPPPAGGRLRVAVIGGIGTEKGYDVLLACARNAAARGLPLDFTVVGHTPDDSRLLETGHVFVTGPYKEAEAIALVQAQRAQFAWLPSIWPETWCFTLGIAWRAGLRVAAFDIGAPAERIRRTGRGWLMPLGLAAPAINTALLGFTARFDAATRLSAGGG
jgi:GT2 family glycosyltransferase/glycosyltransferase involved in cell wall biosynthesis